VRRQFGFDQVQMILAVIALGILAGMFFAAKSYIEGVRKEGYDAGHKAALLAVAQRDNDDLVSALNRVTELEEEKAELEAAHRAAMAAIDAAHEKELHDVHENRDRVIADLRSGNLKLRNARGQADAGCPAHRGGEAGRPPAAAGERDAPAQAGPPAAVDGADDDVEFTIGLLDEGDEAIVDLGACQAILLDWGPRLGAKVP